MGGWPLVKLARLVLVLLALGLALGSTQGQAQAAPSLSRYPYIQNTTPTSAVIAWGTDRPATSEVEYGPTLGYGMSAFSSVLTTRHALTLTGLSPNTAYWYRVKGDGAVLAEGERFRTAKGASATQLTFAVFGDSGSGSQAQRDVALQILRLSPDFVLHTGDVVYDRGEAENFDPHFFLPYRDILKSTPFFLSLGNHDYTTDSGQPYLDAFYLPSNNLAGTERYYSFDYGNAHFVALDVIGDYGLGSAQYPWLEQDLRESSRLWKFVFFHKPPYTSSRHKDDADLPPLREQLSPLFELYSVDMVFNGHDHNYERTVPIRDFYPQGKGVVYIVTGGGGASLYPEGHSAFTAYSESAYHTVYVSIDGYKLTLQAIRSDGSLMDSYILDRSAEAHPLPSIPIPAVSGPGLWLLAVLLILTVVGAIVRRRSLGSSSITSGPPLPFSHG